MARVHSQGNPRKFFLVHRTVNHQCSRRRAAKLGGVEQSKFVMKMVLSAHIEDMPANAVGCNVSFKIFSDILVATKWPLHIWSYLVIYHLYDVTIPHLIFSTVPWNGPPCVSSVWAPKVNTAFKLLLSFRLTSAVWSNISDCDETYNYWEPVSKRDNCQNEYKKHNMKTYSFTTQLYWIMLWCRIRLRFFIYWYLEIMQPFMYINFVNRWWTCTKICSKH